MRLTAVENHPFITEARVFHILDHLAYTAPGADLLPAWFLRLAAPIYTGVITYMINFSIANFYVPEQWKTAIIHPVAKVPKPETPSDYRPISITPILSRIVERELVQRYLYPAFNQPPMSDLLLDQYAFRPTGSTTAALISLQHQVKTLLQSNEYVTLVSLDFSKAFDTVRHSVLAAKLSSLIIPDNIYNWLVEFLKDRRHVTRFQNVLSAAAAIDASVVQGSGIGPSAFVVNGSDLHPRHRANIIVKYADDTYLLVGSSLNSTIGDELTMIGDWAEENHLSLNQSKTKEMVIVRRRGVQLPPPTPGIERVTKMKILGVIVRDDFRAKDQVEATLASCHGTVHALRVLKSHGLPRDTLQKVAEATTLMKMMYAAPAWWGRTSAEDRVRLNRFLTKTKRAGYLRSQIPDVEQLMRDADLRLLTSVSSNPNHVLQTLFPPKVSRSYNLRPRLHNFTLPLKDNTNFISRVLYYTNK